MTISSPLIQCARAHFHRSLLESLLTISEDGVPSNADKHNKTSVAIASGIAKRLQAETGIKGAAQRSGSQFEELVAQFVHATFLKLPHLRPGKWTIYRVTAHNRSEISKYAQYSHLVALQEAAAGNAALAAALGNDYAIAPDVVVTRGLESDAEINRNEFLVDAEVAKGADLREGHGKLPLLHASISTKWTLRSDRAQNARSEALNSYTQSQRPPASHHGGDRRTNT